MDGSCKKFVYPCSCVNIIDPDWGVEKNVSKCQFHVDTGGKLGKAHHEEMGAIKDGKTQHISYELELMECLDELGVNIKTRKKAGTVLEIGCGAGSYIPWLKKKGFDYFGLECDTEIAEHTRKAFRVPVDTRPLESYLVARKFNLILAAHVFEHLKDAPAMLVKTRRMLERGGKLIMIVPNDEDPVNPDHLWFFTPENLKSTLERIGFSNVVLTMKRRVKHEQFIYCVADR
jgi:2-polyprenyl-3-methyl-5-hydroxy-6-metoxy-1,4-benzoquinol methylase